MSEKTLVGGYAFAEEGAIFLRIDRAIWSDQSLQVEQKIVLNFIYQFHVHNLCCTFSPAWIGNKFGWDEAFVTEVVTFLEKLGYIRVRVKDDNYAMSIILPGEPDPCRSLDEIEIN